MHLVSNRFRPIFFGFRTVLLLLMIRFSRKNRVEGWKYFFGSFGVFRFDGGFLDLKSGVWLEAGVLLHCISGRLSVGNRTFVNKGSLIASKQDIRIGNDVLIGDYVSIYDHDHGLLNRSEYATSPVKIEDNVWIGSHAVVLKGVSIGQGSVVAAGSVVTKSIPAGEVWGGVPARFIKSIESSS